MASPRVKIKVDGAKALERQLRGLEPKVRRKILRGAVRAAAQPILADAKANTPVQTGALRSSLKVRAKRARRGSVAAQVVTKDGFFKGEQFYGGFIELGTQLIRAREFMLRAFRGNEAGAVRTIRQAIVSGIHAAARSRR